MEEQGQDVVAPRETWREWVPDAPEPGLEALYTRAGILAELARPATVPPVKESDLRFWERIGVLPQPIRKRRDGATRGLYPPWYAILVRRLRIFQQWGYTLAELPNRLRAEARRLAHDNPIDVRGGVRLPLGLVAALEEWPQGVPFRASTLRPGSPGYEEWLGYLLADIAAIYRERDGIELECAKILFTDRYGKELAFDVPLPALEEQAAWRALLDKLSGAGEVQAGPVRMDWLREDRDSK
jgi:DNA-binding transcriptional MerR regulator